MIAYRLVDEHDCIRQARVIGLFGCADLVDTAGPNAGNRFTTLQGGGPSSEKVLAFKRAMLDEGIISLFRNWCASSSAVRFRIPTPTCPAVAVIHGCSSSELN